MSVASRPPRPRALFVAALLLLTLALAGAIALQAYRNFLGHKATAERVLRDYSRLAAARFAQRTEMAVYYHAFWPALDALSRAKAGRPGTELPAPNHLPVSSEPHAADFRKLARYTFRYDLRGGRLETAGGTPSAAVRRWLRDTLPVHSRTVYDPKEHLGAIVRTVDGLSRAIVYTVVNDKSGAPRTIVGIEEDPRGFEPLYTADEDKFPLLPRPLTGGVSYDSLGSAIVTGADGVELYRSPVQYPPLFAARDSFQEPMMGRLQVQVALRPGLAPLAPLVSEAAEGFAPLAAARGVTLCTELTDGVVAPVDADALRQMLLNLLDNAVKYGPSGQTVTLGLTVADGRARVSVDDEGPGIPAAERERIWDRFWRLERDRGSAVAGTGIGLSVVRELVALHGGRTWVEDAPASERGDPAGSRFVIELPLVPLAHAASGAGTVRADAGATA